MKKLAIGLLSVGIMSATMFVASASSSQAWPITKKVCYWNGDHHPICQIVIR